MTTKNQNDKLHLLVVGVRWPPETFIQLKLVGLAVHGIAVTVAGTQRWGTTNFALPGISFIRLHHWDDPMIIMLAHCMQGMINLLRQGSRAIPILRHLMNYYRGYSLKHKLYLWSKDSLLINQNPDIVNFEWINSAHDYERMLDIWHCPIIVSCRGSQINIRPFIYCDVKKKIVKAFSRATAVHCVSKAIFEKAVELGLDPEKAVIIRPAVNTRFFTPSQNSNKVKMIKQFRIITVGSLIWVKGYEYALMGIKILKEKGLPVELTIIGDGPEKNRVLYTINDLDMNDYVKLTGKLLPEQVRNHLQRSDVFLLSSLSEGISNAVLEAMSCGLPVVTTDCGGMRELVTDGKEGFVIPVRNPQAIASALQKLSKDPKLCLHMGKEARDRIIKNFTLEQHVFSFINLYSKIGKLPKNSTFIDSQ